MWIIAKKEECPQLDGYASVNSKLTCPVFVARDLSGSFFSSFQPGAEKASRTVALGSTIGRALDRGVRFVRRRDTTSGSIS